MGDSKIEWTDETWNPVTGCTKVSPGCKLCYAERLAPKVFAGQCDCGHRIEAHDHNDPRKPGQPTACLHEECPCLLFGKRKFTDVRTHPDRLEQPLHWKKPRKVFVNSMSDLFHEDVPFEFIDKVAAVAIIAHQHIYQCLTKRADRALTYWSAPDRAYRIACALLSFAKPPMPIPDRIPDHLLPRLPLKNWWHGVSVEDRDRLHRIDTLKDIPAAVRFVSFEPLLEDLGAVILDRIHWAIIGGESGPKARPCRIEAIRSLVRQCREQQVTPFVKQLGAQPCVTEEEWRRRSHASLTEKLSGPMPPDSLVPILLESRKGGKMSEWPEDLRVREFPVVSGGTE